VARTAAVFFDVDFTLIHPGPRFQGSGYQASCARYGIQVDAARFDAAVAGASGALDSTDQLYDDALFINYTMRIIELMGGQGPDVETVAREIYDDWAEHRHFELYDDVREALQTLARRGHRLGVISNSHRPLDSFESYFELDGLISVKVSSYDHGFMKPHPSIFEAALRRMGVSPQNAAMVGDSFAHDIVGARHVGMRGILLARRGDPPDRDPQVPVIRSLRELPDLVSPDEG
jgi:HAD superfamily hydrolase (TIGR01662 family)